MAKQSYRIVALPGDGIGPEVLTSALLVLNTVRKLFNVDFEVEEIPCGGHYYAEHETEWPEGSFEKCEAADAILLGAVGHEVNGHPYLQNQVSHIRSLNLRDLLKLSVIGRSLICMRT
jgi:isocitrate/isopropylmalate dehydrogenase